MGSGESYTPKQTKDICTYIEDVAQTIKLRTTLENESSSSSRSSIEMEMCHTMHVLIQFKISKTSGVKCHEVLTSLTYRRWVQLFVRFYVQEIFIWKKELFLHLWTLQKSIYSNEFHILNLLFIKSVWTWRSSQAKHWTDSYFTIVFYRFNVFSNEKYFYFFFYNLFS